MGATCRVLGYALEFFVGLESVVDCYYVEDEYDYNYTTDEERWFLDEAASIMRVCLYSLLALDISLTLLISLLLSITHAIPILLQLLLLLLLLLALPCRMLPFVLFFGRRLWVVLVFFVGVGVDVGAVLLFAGELFALVGLEVVAEDYEELEGVEESQHDVDYHITVVKTAETAP